MFWDAHTSERTVTLGNKLLTEEESRRLDVLHPETGTDSISDYVESQIVQGLCVIHKFFINNLCTHYLR